VTGQNINAKIGQKMSRDYEHWLLTMKIREMLAVVTWV